EHGGAVFARIDRHGGDLRVLAIDYVVPAEHEIDVSGADALQIDPSFWARVSKEAKRRQLSVLPVHTHPFGDGTPRFSSTDIAGERRLLPVVERPPGSPTGGVVVVPTDESVGVWIDDGHRIAGACRDIGIA